MESIGDRLRLLRESKKLTIKEIAKDTNISASYIEALENEDFEKFPGETYVIGFIRSYSEYLKIDAEEVIQAYKGYKIGESVTPLEELTKPTAGGLNIDAKIITEKTKPAVLIGIVIGLVVLGAIFIPKLFQNRNIDISENDSIESMKSDFKTDDTSNIKKIINVNMMSGKGNELAYNNEALQFRVDAKECMFVVRELSSSAATIELLPEGEKVEIQKDKTIEVDFKGVSRKVFISLKASTGNRARFGITVGGEQEEEVVQDDSNDENVSTEVVAQSVENLKITFKARFKAKTYIEIYIDGEPKTRGIIQAGTFRKWEANEYIQVKIGNAGGVDVEINNKKYNFGANNQIANKVIKWKKDPANPNLYKIVVTDWR